MHYILYAIIYVFIFYVLVIYIPNLNQEKDMSCERALNF